MGCVEKGCKGMAIAAASNDSLSIEKLRSMVRKSSSTSRSVAQGRIAIEIEVVL
jgi:hypothetical protein